MVSGLILFLQSPLALALLAMFFWIYYERIIMREEEFLREKFGDEYLRWTERTPVIFPGFSRWEKPSLPFSARTVLRREYSGFFCVIAVMTLFQAIGDWTVKKEFVIDTGWAVIFGLALILYLTLRTLKKKTRILHAPGR
jgi:protein-S-isoprenylcysteine O-methyltransferase Ste14